MFGITFKQVLKVYRIYILDKPNDRDKDNERKNKI